MVLDDPAGNSYIESTGADDTLLRLEHYERTPEQVLLSPTLWSLKHNLCSTDD